MSVAETIAQAAEQIEAGNAADLKLGLQKIANLSKEELTANQSAITYPMQMLAQAVDKNLKSNQQEITADLGVKKLLKQTQQVLPDKIKKQMTPVIRQLEKQTEIAQQQARIQKIKQQQQKNEVKRQIEKQMNKSQEDILKLDKAPKIFVPSQLSAIQQEIYQYKPILDVASVPQITTAQDLPPTMRLLTKYAELQGLKGVGSVSNKGGLSYVGVKQLQDESLGIKTFVPYMLEKQQTKKSIPSISMQLQYYANKTMNSWNRYVDSEAQFVNFISKVNTPTNRQLYMQKQFRTINLATFNAQMIATVSYYYVYLPMMKMASTLNTDPSATPTFSSFLNRYEVATSRQMNPLMLGKDASKLIVNFLFSKEAKQGPVEVGKTLIKLIGSSNITNNLNKTECIKVINYVSQKQSEAKQFLNGNGIQQDLIKQVLASKDWSSVKKKRIVIGKGTTNPFVTQLARKIVKQSSEGKAEIKKIDFQWSSDEILAYDYIWGQNSKF